MDAAISADGKITGWSHRLVADSVLVRARMANGDGVLRSGMFARTRVVFSVREAVLVVPEEALVPLGAKQFVFKIEPDGKGGYTPADDLDVLDKASYDYKGMTRPNNRQFLERVTEAMSAVGADVYQIDHEDATGQYEINYVYSDALTSADRYIFFKMAASFAAPH